LWYGNKLLLPLVLSLFIILSSAPIVYAMFLTPVEIIDSTGDGGGNVLTNPQDVATDSSGNVFVVGPNSGNVFKITPGGNITEIIDSTGGGGSVLTTPFGVATDSSGNVFVTGIFSKTVHKITPGGTITVIIASTGDGGGNTLSDPLKVATDSSGNVFVTGGVSDNVFKITPGGNITEIIDITGEGGGNTLNGPFAIATDSSGNVFVTGQSSDNVFKITPGGTITEIIDSTGNGGGNTLDFPLGVATDSSGNVFVTGVSSGNAFKITPGGNITEIIDSTGDGGGNTLNGPRGIATDSSGNVFVTGSGSDNVFKITPSGTITEIIDSTGDGGGNVLTNPQDVATDSSGNVFVVGRNSNNAFKITPPTSTLKITKNATGGDGIFNFTVSNSTLTIPLSINTNVTNMTSPVTLDPGLYNVTEIVPAGWINTASDCEKNSISLNTTLNLNVTASDSVECIFENTFIPVNATLKITKNAKGGDAIFNFTVSNSTFTLPLSINTTATNMTSPVTIDPGFYNVTEIVPAGWTLDASDCEKNTISLGTTLNFNVTAGDFVECIFENTFNVIQLTLVDSFPSPLPFPLFGLDFEDTTGTLWGNSNDGNSASIKNFDTNGFEISGFKTKPPTDSNTLDVAVNQQEGVNKRIYYWQNIQRNLFETTSNGDIITVTQLPFGHQIAIFAIAFDQDTNLIVAPRQEVASLGINPGFAFINPGVGITSVVDFNFEQTTTAALGFDVTSSDYWILGPKFGGDRIWKIDRNSLEVVLISKLPGSTGQTYRGLAIDEENGLLYTNFQNEEVRVFQIPSSPIIKITKNAIGGNAIFNFTVSNSTFTLPLSINTTATNMTTPITIDPGLYNVTETVPAGWTLDASNCLINGVPQNTTLNINITAGDSVECVFEDTKIGLPPPPPPTAIGGELIPIETTSLILAGTQSVAAWMIPVLVSAIGIGIVIARKF